MDYTIIFIILGLVAYGVFEYQRREREFRRMYMDVIGGYTPSPTAEEPALWRLATLGSVATLVLLFVLYCGVVVVTHPRLHLAIPMALLGLFFLMIFMFLILMFVRDVKALRNSPRG